MHAKSDHYTGMLRQYYCVLHKLLLNKIIYNYSFANLTLIFTIFVILVNAYIVDRSLHWLCWWTETNRNSIRSIPKLRDGWWQNGVGVNMLDHASNGGQSFFITASGVQHFSFLYITIFFVVLKSWYIIYILGMIC